MFILQTLKDFIDNPMGKGSTAITNRQLIRDDLNKRYYTLIKKKKISEPNIYRDGDDYILHFILPSETERDNTYDVVILFTMDEEDFSRDVTLEHYYVKFFSNSPNFTFTYAYAFNQYGLLIDFLNKKFSDEIIEGNPIVRNPGEIISFEKSIYFIGFHILLNRSKYLSKSFLNSHSKKINKTDFFKSVRSMEQIKIDIKNSNNEIRRKKNILEKKKNESRIKNKVVEKISGVKKSIINKVQPKSKIKAKKSNIQKPKI